MRLRVVNSGMPEGWVQCVDLLKVMGGFGDCVELSGETVV